MRGRKRNKNAAGDPLAAESPSDESNEGRSASDVEAEQDSISDTDLGESAALLAGSGRSRGARTRNPTHHPISHAHELTCARPHAWDALHEMS